MKVLAFPKQKFEAANDAPEDTGAAASATATALGGEPPKHYDRITVRAITVALVLSLFLHILVLVVPLMNKADQEMKAPADEIGPLSVTIAQSKPQPKAETPQPEQTPASEEPKPRQPKPTVKPRPAPRPRSQIAIDSGHTPPFIVPAPQQAQPPAPETRPTPQPAPASTEDFSDVLAARQRARRAQNGGAPDEVLESDDQRANRIAQANVQAQQRSASPGQDPTQAGGIFDLRRTGLHEAEFVFNGWNRTFRRSLGQTFEVKQGNNPDIRIAVIRQMIAIIRDQKPGDFEWQSHRLRKVIVMSARPQDQPELEKFLMKEFYPEDPRAQ